MVPATLRNWCDRAIVKVVPTILDRIFTIGRVMPKSDAAKVIGYAETVVDKVG